MTAGPKASIQFSPASDSPEEIALAKLKQAENSFRHSDALLREFSNRSMAVINGRSVFRGDSILSGQELRDQYVGLLRERDKARRIFMEAMQEWATIKTGQNFKVGVDNGS